MNFILVLAVTLMLVAVAAWRLAAWMRGRMEAQTTALRQEMQALLQSQAQTLAEHIGQLRQSVTQDLGQVRGALQQGVSDSGRLASEAQRAVSEQLGRIGQQLGEVQHAGRELSQAARTLELVLSGAQTRGALGEVALDRLLGDALGQSGYQTQFRFSTGTVVDAIIRVRDKILPVDSKFPLDAYRRLLQDGPEARREFAQAVRKHADAIAEKYILPDEHTLDFAMMFVPSESVYYELLMTEDAKAGQLADYCVRQRVVPVSPNTLYAYLNVILMGLRGMQIEENARRLLGSLAGLAKQFETFADVYERLGTHLRNAQQSYAEADLKLERARIDLEQMARGALPESPPKALGAAGED